MAEKPSGYKNPPVLSETKSYQQWSKKIALVVILSLSGKARETALEIKTRPS